MDSSRVAGEQEYFACPVCRKAQVLDLSAMQVYSNRLCARKQRDESAWIAVYR